MTVIYSQVYIALENFKSFEFEFDSYLRSEYVNTIGFYDK